MSYDQPDCVHKIYDTTMNLKKNEISSGADIR